MYRHVDTGQSVQVSKSRVRIEDDELVSFDDETGEEQWFVRAG